MPAQQEWMWIRIGGGLHCGDVQLTASAQVAEGHGWKCVCGDHNGRFVLRKHDASATTTFPAREAMDGSDDQS